VTEVEEETATVVTVKVAVVLPAGTVTEAGTVAAAVLLLDKVTVVPPVGADVANVTVPWEEAPPVTEIGLKLKELKATGAMVKAAVLEELPLVAVMVTEVEAETANVVTVNVAVVLPDATVTEAGTVAAAGLLLDKVTVIPPVGADAANVTVAWEEVPPVTEVGLKLKALKATGATVKVAVWDEPL
jgi:hypothetical protein